MKKIIASLFLILIALSSTSPFFYVWADDGGERVQIAIAMTCPKTPIAAENEAAHTAWDWSEDTPTTPIRGQRAEVMKPKVEITQEEQDKIADMIKRFGL